MTSNSDSFTILADSKCVLVRLHAAMWRKIDSLEQLDEDSATAVDANPQAQVLFDLHQVELVSSGFLGWLAALNAKLKPTGRRVHLYHLCACVDNIFRQVAFDREMCIHPPDEEPHYIPTA